MIRTLPLALLLAGSVTSLSFQDPPKVRLNLAWIDTSLDVWEELREVDPAFKKLGDNVARLAKGLEAEEVDERAKAATQLKALGLTAYGPLKALRGKAGTQALQAEFDYVLKALVGEFDEKLAPIPGSRLVGADGVKALGDRLKEKKVARQMPSLMLVNGQPANIFVGDSRPGVKVRKITIEGNGDSAKLEHEGPLFTSGINIEVVPKVDGAKGTVTLAIKATARATVGLDPVEVNVRLTPELGGKGGFLAGPFPSAEEKGDPWWILVKDCLVMP